MKAFANGLKRFMAVIFTVVLIADLVPAEALVMNIYATESGSVAAGDTSSDNVTYPSGGSESDNENNDSNTSDGGSSTESVNNDSNTSGGTSSDNGNDSSTTSGDGNDTESNDSNVTNGGDNSGSTTGKDESGTTGKTESGTTGKTESNTDSGSVTPSVTPDAKTPTPGQKAPEESTTNPSVIGVGLHENSPAAIVGNEVILKGSVTFGVDDKGNTLDRFYYFWKEGELTDQEKNSSWPESKDGTVTWQYKIETAGEHVINLYVRNNNDPLTTVGSGNYKVTASDTISVNATTSKDNLMLFSTVEFQAELSGSVENYDISWSVNDGADGQGSVLIQDAADPLHATYTISNPKSTGKTHTIKVIASPKNEGAPIDATCDIFVKVVQLEDIKIENDANELFKLNQNAIDSKVDINDTGYEVDFNNNGGSERRYTVIVIKPDGSEEELKQADSSDDTKYVFPADQVGIFTINVSCQTEDENANPKAVSTVIKYIVRQPLTIVWDGNPINKKSNGTTAVKASKKTLRARFSIDGLPDDAQKYAKLDFTDMAKATYSEVGPGKNIGITFEHSEEDPFFVISWNKEYQDRSNFYYIKNIPNSVTGNITATQLDKNSKEIDLTKENADWKLSLSDSNGNPIGVTLRIDSGAHIQNSWFNVLAKIIDVENGEDQLIVYGDEIYENESPYNGPGAVNCSTSENPNKVTGIYVKKKDGTVYGPLSVIYNYDNKVPDFGGITIDTTQKGILWDKTSETHTATDDVTESGIDFKEDGAIVVTNKKVTLSNVETKDAESGPNKAQYVDGNGVFCSETKITTKEAISKVGFSDSVTLEAAEESKTYYVYVKLVDNAGNISYRGINGEILTDKTAPTATITFDQSYAGATANLKVEAKDDASGSGIYSITARVYDGLVDSKPNFYYEKALYDSTDADYSGNNSPITENLEITDPGSQQWVMIIVKDWAGNVTYYDHNGIAYNEEEEWMSKVNLENTFMVYPDDMKVQIQYSSEGSGYAVRKNRDNNPINDYIFIDRTEIHVTFSNIPVSDLSYKWQGTLITAEEYDAINHCYKFDQFDGSIESDGEYTFILNVPKLNGDKSVKVEGIDEFASATTSDTGLTTYTDKFIKDSTAPVVDFIVNKDIAGSKDNTYYYGLKDKVTCEKDGDCEDITINITVEEENWYEEDIPKLYITYKDKDGNSQTSEAEAKWSSDEDAHTHKLTYTIESKADHSADGSYTFLLSNTGENGSYVNYHEFVDKVVATYKNKEGDHTKTCVIDTVRPILTYMLTSDGYNDEYAKKDKVIYFKSEFTETFTVNDVNKAPVKIETYYKAPDTDLDPDEQSGIDVSITAKEDGIYWYTVSGADLAGNLLTFAAFAEEGGPIKATQMDQDCIAYANVDNKGNFTTYRKVLDTTSPKVAYQITELKDHEKHQYAEADYYNYKDGFTVTFKVNELNFDAEKITADGFGWKSSEDEPVLERIVNVDGEYIFTISGEDKAGNKIKVTKDKDNNKSADPDESGEDGVYTTHKKVLDRDAPKYKVEEMTEPASAENVEGDRVYFNKNISVKFKVTDPYLDDKKIKATIASKKGAGNYEKDEVSWSDLSLNKDDKGSGNATEINRSLSVSATKDHSNDGIYRFEIAGEDKAGNKLVRAEKNCDINNKAYNRTEPHGDGTGEFWTMIKVIDTVAPQGEITIGKYYTADLKSPKVLEVRTSEPYRKETSASGTVKVTSDNSPVKIAYPLTSQVGGKNQGKLFGDYKYNNSVSFSTQGEQVFYLTVTLTDRAGNTTGPIKTNSIYLDVTPPVEDTLAPSINIVANANSSAHGPSGNPLFSSNVPFTVVVTDPNATARSSGLYEITYEFLVDGQVKKSGSLKGKDKISWNGNYQDKDQNLTYSFDNRKSNIPVVADSSFNSNNIVIRVKASDHSGNTSQKEYNFGIDITAPKISVTYDNNDVQNEKYFKADRTATIVVTERNFDPSRINIATNGGSQSDWSFSNNGGNGDNDTWTKRITYGSDGDYTFGVTGSDLLGHQASDITYNGAAPREFTVDKTIPVISISFDIGQGYKGSKYFNETRTGTVTIVEHNFRASDARVDSPGSISRGEQPSASQGGWSDSGDNHYMSIVFDQDGDYTITANYTDLAGNVALVATADEFTIDKTKPEIEFDSSTVQANHAYQGVIAPRITFSDTNYDPEGVTFTLTGIKDSRGKVLKLTEVFSDETGYGGSISYENFANIRANDDIYTATGIIVDRAGNQSEVTITFSVNRFGSTWDYNDDKTTEGLIHRYTNEEKDVFLREINVNEVTEYSIFMTHDSDVVELKEGTDYEVNASEATGWKQYVYKFYKKNFEAEGTYNIVVQTKDAAGNSNTNSSMKNENGSEAVPLQYSVDKTCPYATLDGVDLDEKLYNQAALDLFVKVFDALSGVYKVEIFIYPNNAAEDAAERTVPAYKYENTEKDNALERVLLANNDEIPFTIGQHNSPQTVRVVTYDAAGNISEMIYTNGQTVKGEILWDGVLVSTNVASQVFYNRPLFIGLIAVLLLLLLILFLIWRRRKNQENLAG